MKPGDTFLLEGEDVIDQVFEPSVTKVRMKQERASSDDEKRSAELELFKIEKEKDYFRMVFLPYLSYAAMARCDCIPGKLYADGPLAYEEFLKSRKGFERKYKPGFLKKYLSWFRDSVGKSF
jgi:hypothetical protein